MSHLTFSVSLVDPSNNGHLVLAEVSDSTPVGKDAWDRMAEEIASEATLIHYPSSILEARWLREYAAITLHEGRIVSYICLAPMYSEENRHKFARALDLDPAHLPAIDIFEFTTAWTAPEWRRYGISGQMRPPLLERFFRTTAFGASGMAGLASPVLSKLGWRIVGWSRLPFISSLTAIPVENFETESTRGWHPPGHLKRYEGEHIPLDNASHPWKDFTYFWVSDIVLAEILNAQFAEAAGYDLYLWRKAIIDVFQTPEELHTVAFLE